MNAISGIAPALRGGAMLISGIAPALRGGAMLMAVGLALCACSNDAPIDVHKPVAPDLQPLLDAYAAPTAALTADVVPVLLTGLLDQVAAADALQLDRRLIEAARTGLAQAQIATASAAPAPLTAGAGIAASVQALTVRGEGYLIVTRICDGWDLVPVPDYANGTIQLTVGFDERGVDPVLWGTLTACRYRYGEQQLLIDGIEAEPRAGDVRIFVGRDITFENFGVFPDPVLVDIAAQVLVDGRELTGRLSFRVDVVTRALEVLVPVGSGHLIAALAPDRSAIQLRALNGVFVCDAASARCTAPTGETIGAP